MAERQGLMAQAEARDEVREAEETPKRHYSAPRLVRHGAVDELTRGIEGDQATDQSSTLA